jgi:nitrogen fixation-related uncharacterized protein
MKFPHQITARFFYLYIDGFRNLSSWGKKLWIIIIIKLLIMFVILKIFFFPDILNKKYDNDAERAEHVRDQLINSPKNND